MIPSFTSGLASFRCIAALEDMPAGVAEVDGLVDEAVRAQCGYGCGQWAALTYGPMTKHGRAFEKLECH